MNVPLNGPGYIHFAYGVPVRLIFHEVDRRLCSQDGVRKKIRMVLRVDRHYEDLPRCGEVGIGVLWERPVRFRSKGSHKDGLFSTRPILEPVKAKAILFEEINELQVFDSAYKSSYVDLLNPEPQSIIENYL